MYPASLEYQEKIKSTNRTFKTNIQIRHSEGITTLTDADISFGTVNFSESSQAGEDYTVGSATASKFSFEIKLNDENREQLKNIKYTNAVILPTVSLLLQEGIDAHFVQPTQPSKYEGFEDRWEAIPLGVFNIDFARVFHNTIVIKSMDNMVKLDKPYRLSKLSYPATLYQIYIDICSVCDVSPATTAFPNQNYLVNSRPSGDFSFRDILKYVAGLAGCFARMNRMGFLELTWYKQTGLELSTSNRFNFEPADHTIKITGVSAETEDTAYLIGTDEYVIDLTNNPLLQGGHSTVLNNVFNNIKDIEFTPFQSQWQGNPALQAGDIITQVDKKGVIYKTIVTNSMYKYLGRSSLNAKGLPPLTRGYQGSSDKAFALIKQRVQDVVDNELTDLQQAQYAATQLLANMLGGHFIEDTANGILYIADNPDINQAMKVWKFGINGFGYYPAGINNPPSSSFTANDTITAMVIAANIITANMVRTGILESEDGSTWINLDNGEFNFKNALKWSNNQLVISGADLGSKVFNTTPVPPYKVNDLWKVSGVPGVEFRICTTARASGSYVASDWANVQDSKQYTDLIKNLTSGTAINGGIVTIDRDRVRVAHAGSNQYSEVRYDGFFRNWENGLGAYLNDIFIHYEVSSNQSRPYPVETRVYLPARFKNRRVNIAVGGGNTYFNVGRRYGDGTVGRLTRWVDTVYQVFRSDMTAATPYVDVDAYVKLYEYDANDDPYTDYIKAGFILIVIGE